MGDYQLKRKQAIHRYNCPHFVRHATRFMALITVGCTTQPTIGTSTRETGVASPTFEPSRCTTGSITMVGPLPGITPRRPFTTVSIRIRARGDPEEAMSGRISVAILVPIHTRSPMERGTIRR